MFRILTCVLALSILGPAAASQSETLNSPREAMMVSAGGEQVMAFYAVDAGIYRLTVVITDGEGSVVRARVPLADGQAHGFILGASDTEPGQRLMFRRLGERLTVELDDADGVVLTATD